MIEDESYLRTHFDPVYQQNLGFADCCKPLPRQSWRGVYGECMRLKKTQLLISNKQFEHNACNASGWFQHQLLSIFHNLWGGHERDQSRGNVSWKRTQHNLSTRTNVTRSRTISRCDMIIYFVPISYDSCEIVHIVRYYIIAPSSYYANMSLRIVYCTVSYDPRDGGFPGASHGRCRASVCCSCTFGGDDNVHGTSYWHGRDGGFPEAPNCLMMHMY